MSEPEKFGDDDQRYREQVPRLDFVAGAMRLLRWGRRGEQR
jgi:hypothetical protein